MAATNSTPVVEDSSDSESNYDLIDETTAKKEESIADLTSSEHQLVDTKEGADSVGDPSAAELTILVTRLLADNRLQKEKIDRMKSQEKTISTLIGLLKGGAEVRAAEMARKDEDIDRINELLQMTRLLKDNYAVEVEHLQVEVKTRDEEIAHLKKANEEYDRKIEALTIANKEEAILHADCPDKQEPEPVNTSSDLPVSATTPAATPLEQLPVLTPTRTLRVSKDGDGTWGFVGANGLITHVFDGTSAARAGLQRGDRIVSVNGFQLANVAFSEKLGLLNNRFSTFVVRYDPHASDNGKF